MNITFGMIATILIYLFITGFLGYLGWKRTKNAADYLVGGRQIHPLIMALSYGATFISTSAIVGFGGMAAVLGMSVLWLTFLNIFVGIFLAFVVFGKRTRRMGLNLDAHTFPEFIGRRFDSKFIQWFAGALIFVLMPLYASAVLIGASRILEGLLGLNYTVAVLIFAVLVGAYVIFGGIKGVMYTDALQGGLMFLGMLVLLIFSYAKVGGVVSGHTQLAEMGTILKKTFVTSPPPGSPLWWTIYSSIVLGVGIGVLAQPQLIVRFMTVKSNREINRAVLIGGLFIMMATGTAFVSGALSNAYFNNHYYSLGTKTVSVTNANGTVTESTSTVTNMVTAMAMTVYSSSEIPAPQEGVRLQLPAPNPDVKPNLDKIIPAYVGTALPGWFGYLFMLVILAAAMSTLSSQFHTTGTAIGRDFYEQLAKHRKGKEGAVTITKVGIFASLLVTVLLALKFEGNIIARATAIFFGVMASMFLAPYSLAIYWKRVTKKGAIAGIITGFAVSLVMFLFFHDKEADAFGIVSALTHGAAKNLYQLINPDKAAVWGTIDPLIFGLPLSFLVTIVVSLFTKVENSETIKKSFEGIE